MPKSYRRLVKLASVSMTTLPALCSDSSMLHRDTGSHSNLCPNDDTELSGHRSRNCSPGAPATEKDKIYINAHARTYTKTNLLKYTCTETVFVI